MLAGLQQGGLQLEAILVTHHHPDHFDGLDELRNAAVAQAARSFNGASPKDGVGVFATLRQWKNEFK